MLLLHNLDINSNERIKDETLEETVMNKYPELRLESKKMNRESLIYENKKEQS